MAPRWLSEQEWLSQWKTGIGPLQGNYLGFYSSIVDGFFKEPWGYWIPVDDHMVHRGDGVFEAIRIVNHAYFDLPSHLARLARSTEKVFLKLPFSLEEIGDRCLQLAKLSEVAEGVLRLYIARGPGGFTTNPYEPKRSQLYMAMTPWKQRPVKWYEDGVRAGVSLVAGKRPFDAVIKSCNYLQNVLQTKDALDRGLDFTVCLNESGHVLEGSTESFFVINQKNEMLIPSTQVTLNGTTLNIVRRLADKMVSSGRIQSVGETLFRETDILAAKEVAFVGTTIGVCPVTRWESAPIGDGQVGPIARELGRVLEKTMQTDDRLRTHF